MKIIEKWKQFTEDYSSCECHEEYNHFLLENLEKFSLLQEFSNGIKYPDLIRINNQAVNVRGGSAGSATSAGYGQDIKNPSRPGQIKLVHGVSKGQPKTRRFIYRVPPDDWPNSKNEDYTVVVQFSKKGPSSKDLKQLSAAERLKKLDVMVKCDCPFFIWNGPEYNATQNNYLYPASKGSAPPMGYDPTKAKWNPQMVSPKGSKGYWKGDYADTAADMGIRDPDREYYICKHVAAVFRNMENFLRLPVSWYRASEKAQEQGITDPGYPGQEVRQIQESSQISFVFTSKESD